MIAIVDYGMGNLFSVSKALERLNYEYIVTSDSTEILNAQGVILPGVGAFGDAVKNLQEMGLLSTIKEVANRKIPLLGICLGMQLLFEESEEHGIHQGLGLLPGRVVKFSGNFKIPHMGWNKLNFQRASQLTDSLEEGFVYFVHSYFVSTEVKEVIIANTHYYENVPAIVGRDNIFGMQFHPEKSGQLGIELLRNFVLLAEK